MPEAPGDDPRAANQRGVGALARPAGHSIFEISGRSCLEILKEDWRLAYVVRTQDRQRTDVLMGRLGLAVREDTKTAAGVPCWMRLERVSWIVDGAYVGSEETTSREE